MGFVRCLEEKQLSALQSETNAQLYGLLKADVLSGVVFPAVRKNELYFYYQGGCLYKLHKGKFIRDKNYEKYGKNLTEACQYTKAKKEIEQKFTNVCGNDKERRLLNGLYSATFDPSYTGDAVVLDIEVNFNGMIGQGKKCDLALYNTKLRTLMFVEGKVFTDKRVNVKVGSVPEVIEQVNGYSRAVEEQEQTIIEQYENYIDIINKLFDASFASPVSVVKPSKLLVYETPSEPTLNNKYSIDSINLSLGKNNIVWCKKDEYPSVDEIWYRLCK